MSEMTNVNIRMDKELKKQFETFCNDVGMSMTTAFTIFAKKVVREQTHSVRDRRGDAKMLKRARRLTTQKRHRPQQSVQQRGRADGGAEC